ncbi:MULTISPECIES: hypothetical protein [Bacteroidaceae]|uniref:Glycosyltransferase family 2 protein n=2 Tax=Bacteroides acidifaciens TaxID=85831 RepID=A0A7K3MNR1_9BACE|nr:MULTISPECIES: hypothetical protein [Bacteroidaceae]MBF0729636.1 hypothetical protein [Bacteroides acidifaciens]MBF0834904.1 hypothetical protein [Bacteroides acidifaciens]NDO56160.1 hypothetical protein [Bacteroides acidifaciens]TFU49929.1 hypothetical protein E4T97_08770 [Bacteroides acidifaciens]GFH86104.1 hypothetical protein IMSAGC001_01510 [Bacteroides acidifaciens]
MKPFKTDIAVAMIFFNRPDTLKTVFESVREAQPSKLYLIQDGARANRPKDVENVAKCREVVSNIDWECEVVHDYSDINLGCGKRIFTGLSNVFMHEEYAAIVEDDIVIGESFLPFCKEMCERYKDDQRIHMISGMNHLGVYEECPYDYFFSQGGGAIWGWATWARCWNELDWNMEAVSNNYIVNCLKNGNTPNNVSKVIAERALVIRQGILKGVSPTFWSLHFGLYGYLGSRLNIVPKYNLISNIGLTGDSAHATDSVNKLVKRIRVVFFSKIYEMPNKLRHPKYIIDDQIYMKKQNAIMNPSWKQRLVEIPERIYLKLFK